MGDPSDPKTWNDLYLAGDAGWDKGEPSPPIVRLVAEGHIAPGSLVCVVGAGRGHEALLLAEKGYKVTAVDFAEEAAKAMRDAAAKRKVVVDVRQRDLFTLAKDYGRTFHAIVEHTCFCAIDPARRAEYVKVMHDCLRAGGILLGLFYAHNRPGGPPFTTTEEEVRRLFEPLFEIERLVVAKDSFEARKGNELEFIFRKK
ncbi:MAG TPA: methyltransferase domain-containing protein [bacterium]|nr:methyltransferase domain-containing protein [bacterium]